MQGKADHKRSLAVLRECDRQLERRLELKTNPYPQNFDVLRCMKQAPVIVLTAPNQDGDKVEAYNLNLADYVLQPSFSAKNDPFVEAIAAWNKYGP